MKGSRSDKSHAQVEDFDLEKRRKDRERDLARKEIKNITIAERLTLSALERTIDVPFKDSHGKFTVKMHTPLRSEYDEIVRIQDELMKGENPKQIQKEGDTLLRLIASLSVDDTLDYAFWKDGDYDPMDMIHLMEAITSRMTEKMVEAQSFRKN